MTYSVLVYPNITYARDLEKDSYVVVLRNLIEQLTLIRDDIEWTILSPAPIRSLEFPNTEQIPIQLPTYPNTMRTHFDATSLLKVLNWKNWSYDAVFSHLPEHTLALKNLIHNKTNERPEFVGYTHWTEFPEITGYSMTMMDVNILGLLEMLRCGINTQAQKDLLLRNAATRFNDSTLADLDRIVQPMYLGAEQPDYTPEAETKTIVFNHRPHVYKSYDWFLAMMDRLWSERQDFTVWVPLAATAEREYMNVDRFDRHGYLSRLSACRVGVAGAQRYSGWSVSATDGMSVGVPYIFHDEASYRELAGDAGIYFHTDDEFIAATHRALDDSEWRDRKATEAVDRFVHELAWAERIKPFSAMLDEAFGASKSLQSATGKYSEALDMIRSDGPLRKKDITDRLGWGVGIPWTPYRNMLRSEGVSVSRSMYQVR